jgi:hypothetical protein
MVGDIGKRTGTNDRVVQTIAIKIDRDCLYYHTIVLLCYPIHHYMVIYKYNNK